MIGLTLEVTFSAVSASFSSVSFYLSPFYRQRTERYESRIEDDSEGIS